MIGQQEKDKKRFAQEMMRVFPNNDEKRWIEDWKRYSYNGVLQVVMNVEEGVVVAIMKAIENDTTWELSSRFIGSMQEIAKFDPSEMVSGGGNNGFTSNGFVGNKPQFVLDDILNEVIEKGHDSLSQAKKDFLAKMKAN